MPKIEPHLQVFNAAHEPIGHFDGEFFYTKPPANLRVDGDEIYSLGPQGKLVGYFQNNRVELLDGSIPYYCKE